MDAFEREIQIARKNLNDALEKKDWYLCNFYQSEIAHLELSRTRCELRWEEIQEETRQKVELEDRLYRIELNLRK